MMQPVRTKAINRQSYSFRPVLCKSYYKSTHSACTNTNRFVCVSLGHATNQRLRVCMCTLFCDCRL